jgi:hypothetical protein
LSVRGSRPAEVIDLTVQSEDNEFLNSRLPVDKQLATLKAIQDYNNSLPKARRKKDALPEIKVHGITAQEILRREPKKKELFRATTYHAMGIAEGYIDNTSSDDACMFSLSAKKHALQRASSQQKIEKIRMHYGKFIGAGPQVAAEQADNVDNPFMPHTVHKHMSLSVYNRPKEMAVRRPKTAATQHDMLKRLPGYKVPAAKDGQPEAAAEPEAAREPLLPEINIPTEFEMITKDAIDCARQRDMQEVLAIHDSLI